MKRPTPHEYVFKTVQTRSETGSNGTVALDISLDLYVPENNASKVPVVAWWHGGGLLQVRFATTIGSI